MQATTALQGTFTHTPRPAITSNDKRYRYQRRFGRGREVRDHVLQPSERHTRRLDAELDVYRDGETDLAEVHIKLGCFATAEITVRLTPAELRELAACLLDAAHDIETLPAAVLAQEAA
jgi:hypothetical protein